MNLYQIIFEHYGPKDMKDGVHCLLFAQNDEEVFNYMVKNGFAYWDDPAASLDEEDYLYVISDSSLREGKFKGTLKECVLKYKGDFMLADYFLEGTFYGVTLWGWECLIENVDSEQFRLFSKLSIVEHVD